MKRYIPQPNSAQPDSAQADSARPNSAPQTNSAQPAATTSSAPPAHVTHPTSPTPRQEPLGDPATAALALRDLTRRFGNKIAVSNISLDIPRGSFYGIVGPNGAGKSTTIAMATGLVRPTNGTAYYDGIDIWGEESQTAKTKFGLLADGIPVFDRLSGLEYLQYLGALRNISAAEVTQRSTSLLQAFDLDGAKDKYICDYSAGMTKKILLAGAMLHRPDILILDEPLEAVDPVSAQTISQILQRYVASGKTVVLSSHTMSVVEELCDHVAIIAAGTVRAHGAMEAVCGQKSLQETFVELVGAHEVDEEMLAWLY